VLIAAGSNLASCELYDPQTKTWSAVNSLHLGRSDHQAVLLADGRVLITGGWSFPLVVLATVKFMIPPPAIGP